MRIERIGPENRTEANCFLEERWFTTSMALRGELVDMTCADGFALYERGEMQALVTYRYLDDETMEMLSLDSASEHNGYGSALLDTLVGLAEEHGCRRIVLVTTNDNLHALRFYQKRGFDLVTVHRNALDAARALKPEIPMIGYYGIPIRHELELERLL